MKIIITNLALLFLATSNVNAEDIVMCKDTIESPMICHHEDEANLNEDECPIKELVFDHEDKYFSYSVECPFATLEGRVFNTSLFEKYYSKPPEKLTCSRIKFKDGYTIDSCDL